MLFTPYNQLPPEEKALVAHKVTIRTKAPQKIVDEVLSVVNPKVKIKNKNVITIYHILDSVQQKIKERIKENTQ
ncbi:MULTISPECIES: hypothetical protein [Aquimarina]|uniref:hypothetical protein n=1 Tax=Aquimarina TaxID=290174 RepID=UPI000CDF2160|nr:MULTISPECIES: hypothetical protein [Aquimarina]